MEIIWPRSSELGDVLLLMARRVVAQVETILDLSWLLQTDGWKHSSTSSPLILVQVGEKSSHPQIFEDGRGEILSSHLVIFH